MQFSKALCAVAVVAIASLSSAAAIAQQKTEKACRDEWRADKAAMQKAGTTEKAYVEKCRAGTTATPPAAAAPMAKPAPAPAAAAPAPAVKPAATAPARAAKPAAAAPTAGTPSGAGQFATEAQAKVQCPTDTVVWVNTNSGIYHFSGHKDYGKTKKGAYMCEKTTAAAGFRAAKDEKHP